METNEVLDVLKQTAEKLGKKDIKDAGFIVIASGSVDDENGNTIIAIHGKGMYIERALRDFISTPQAKLLILKLLMTINK